MIRSDLSLPKASCCWLSCRLLLCGLAVCTAISACGYRETRSSQSVASVNGNQITTDQLSVEVLQVDGVPDQSSGRRALDTLIDRHLLQGEAIRNRLDRDPRVIAAIEGAKSEILAQAYMQNTLAHIAKPSQKEVVDYFNRHPEFFSRRKLFDMNELAISVEQVTDELKMVMDGAKSLDDVAAWLDGQRISYAYSKLARSSADLPATMAARLQTMQKGQMFVIREGASALLLSIVDIQDSPLTVEAAAAQIEQMLIDRKHNEIRAAEVARLRASAKVEYLNQPAPQFAGAQAAVVQTRPAGISSGTSLQSRNLQLQ